MLREIDLSELLEQVCTLVAEVAKIITRHLLLHFNDICTVYGGSYIYLVLYVLVAAA